MTTLALVALLVCVALISWCLIGRLKSWLLHKQVVDQPNHRTVHLGAVPRGGGLVVVAILFVSLIAMGIVSQRYQLFSGFAALVFCWGFLSWRDDLSDLSPVLRLALHLCFAFLTILAFGYVGAIELSQKIVLQLGFFGAVCSLIGLLWFTNLFNFMDGIDGLAASQTIIASITLAFWFWQAGDPHIALCCMVLAAATYGFLLRNWHPASIFMGDVGSITLGAFFATLIIVGVTRYQIPVISFVLLFSIFIADASITIIRRLLRGDKIWLPHREHYYQRLAIAGVNHANIVIALVILMLINSIIASTTVLEHDRIAVAVLATAVIIFLSVFYVHKIESKKL